MLVPEHLQRLQHGAECRHVRTPRAVAVLAVAVADRVLARERVVHLAVHACDDRGVRAAVAEPAAEQIRVYRQIRVGQV